MTSAAWRSVRQEVDLPASTAVWVLTAHVLTILSPVVVIWALLSHPAVVADRVAEPWLLYVGACVLVVASVAESAQNTLDRWYLLGTPPSLLDLVFNSLVVTFLALTVVAVWGYSWAVPGLLAVVAFVALYLLGGPTQVVQAVAGLGSALALYSAFRDPVVFLSLVAVFLTLFCLDVLLRTRQQAMHGFVTLVNVIGLLAIASAIRGAAAGTPWSWSVTVAVGALAVVVPVALRPRLLALPATPRRAPLNVP